MPRPSCLAIRLWQPPVHSPLKASIKIKPTASIFPILSPWLERYLNNRYIGIDPVALTGMRSQQTSVWNHRITKQNMAIEYKFLEDARGYGVPNAIIGETIDPPSGRISLVAFVGGTDKDTFRYQVVADYSRSCLHYALTKNIPEPANESIATAPLQPRETDVLVWTEEGKPTWAIGRILDISKRTVQFP